MMRSILAVAAAALVASPALADRAADEAAIRQAVLDYLEGWYEGDAARMERAVHPELQKRIVRVTDEGRSALDNMGASRLVEAVRSGGGRKTPAEKRQKDVTILDVYENTATVKSIAADFIDYLHLARWNGRWVIVNVLWELKPEVLKARGTPQSAPAQPPAPAKK